MFVTALHDLPDATKQQTGHAGSARCGSPQSKKLYTKCPNMPQPFLEFKVEMIVSTQYRKRFCA